MGGAKGVDRPQTEDTVIGRQFIELLGKADRRTQQMFDMIQPLLGTAQGQAGDVLAGGSGPFTPAIQSAIGSTGQQLSQSTDRAIEEWNRMGITGTDFARLSADAERAGGQQLAGIPSTFTGPLLAQIFAALTGTQVQAVQAQGQGLGAAAGVTGAAIQPITGRTTAQDIANILQGAGSVVGAVRS